MRQLSSSSSKKQEARSRENINNIFLVSSSFYSVARCEFKWSAEGNFRRQRSGLKPFDNFIIYPSGPFTHPLSSSPSVDHAETW